MLSFKIKNMTHLHVLNERRESTNCHKVRKAATNISIEPLA